MEQTQASADSTSLDAMEQRAADAERRAAEAWLAYHRLAARVGDAGRAERTLEALRSSLSWRLTAPLRWGVAVLRALLRMIRRHRSASR